MSSHAGADVLTLFSSSFGISCVLDGTGQEDMTAVHAHVFFPFYLRGMLEIIIMSWGTLTRTNSLVASGKNGLMTAVVRKPPLQAAK